MGKLQHIQFSVPFPQKVEAFSFPLTAIPWYVSCNWLPSKVIRTQISSKQVNSSAFGASKE